MEDYTVYIEPHGMKWRVLIQAPDGKYLVWYGYGYWERSYEETCFYASYRWLAQIKAKRHVKKHSRRQARIARKQAIGSGSFKVRGSK